MGVIAALRRLSLLPDRRWWAVLLSVALATRLLWALAMQDRMPVRGDETAYIGHAERLAGGLGYVTSDGRPTAYWPVGYPAVLSLTYRVFGNGLHVGIVLQGLAGVLTCVLVSLIGTRAHGPLVGRTAALGLAIYPTHVFYTTLHLAEPLAALFVAVATWLVVPATSGAAALGGGVALGIAALFRPVLVALPAALPFGLARRSQRLRARLVPVTLVTLGMVVTVGPWIVRNRQAFGSWTLSTTGGLNFWMGSYPGAFGGYRHDVSVIDSMRVNGQLVESRGYRLGLQSIADAPARAALRTVQKLSYFFALETDGALWNIKGLPDAPPRAVTLFLVGIAGLGWVAVVVLAIPALLVAPGDALGRWLVLLTAYQAGMAMIFVGDPRYHFGLVPIAMILAARGLVEWVPRFRAADLRRDAGLRRLGWRWMAIVLVFFVLLAGNLLLKVQEARTLGPA
jgi:4-amino-4-deoxy-L-arabinose transferase-like glycosyltransferase